MSCEQFQALLDQMSLGALTADRREAMEAHARECPDCAMLLALRTLDEEVSVPDTCGYAWRQAVKQEASRRARKPGRTLKALCAAAAVVVFLCGGTLITRATRTNDMGAPLAMMDGTATRMKARTFDLAGEEGQLASNAPNEAPQAAVTEAAPTPSFLSDLGAFSAQAAPYLILLAALVAAAIPLRRHIARRATKHKEETP